MEKIFVMAVVFLGIIALSVVLGLPSITYWQAYGLYILSTLLFKSSSSSSSSKS